MKEPIEYLGHVSSFTNREELYNIGRQMQTDVMDEMTDLAINFAMYCSGRAWDMIGYKYGANTYDLWEEYMVEINKDKNQSK